MSEFHRQADLRIRCRTILSLAVIVPLGLVIKFYNGPGSDWLNDSFGGVPYQIFWCLFGLLLFPRVSPARFAVTVFVATCAVEFLQLWHPPFLEWVRSFLVGRLVLGTTFVWTDFIWYGPGCLLGWVWMRWLQKAGAKPDAASPVTP